ncbi:MAG: single-stranded-DNA-specific exonuclease RecJ [Ectothiorhodospiraceae bacterium]|nr:single-stranded-DNA-specific exonuclease RecJ [Ectothiorhodospiraceae bacterium]
MDARWNIRPPGDPEKVRLLVEEIHVPDIIASILVSRGIEDYDSAKRFFRPSLQQLHNPFLMHDMEKAVSRVINASEQGEKVLVFGDYDVDGTNSASLLYLYLKRIGLDVEVYIPDRMSEGYGISEPSIDYAAEKGVKLLVSIDCGITAVSQVEYAKGKGIDVIICDHHEPAEEIPDAYAVLDPIKPLCKYPFKYLSGAGVGFKLIQGLAEYFDEREVPYEYLDFVAIAAAADIVPMIGENRILVYYGLKLLNENPRPGIKALMESANLTFGDLTAQQIVFVMAPRINAVGRLGDATRAVDLLTAEDYGEAISYAQVLEEENRNRRVIDEETYNAAQEVAEQYIKDGEDDPIVLHDNDWHPGVIGIVASRLVEKYYRPTVLLTTVDGVAKGSARSISNFNIYEALKSCEDLLLQFGGHKYAAGLAIEIENIPAFRERFVANSAEMITDDMLQHEIKADAMLRLSDITPRFFRILKQFAPFGPGNMRPIFFARDVEIYGQPRIVGKDHLKLKFRQDGVVFDSIGFNLGSRLDLIKSGQKNADILFTVEDNNWNGNVFPQLKLKDLRITNEERTNTEILNQLSAQKAAASEASS